ncbi:hypothetical protein JST99_02565 [Candidatus Dependentiae bacterium]|nr:hypothetical protein [Candidatus Dependentiae bacterium]MCC7414548.1 hypothetical protein [Campylobacterota bacterium]
MNCRQKSRVARIILLCLGLTVVEKGWVTNTHPFEIGAVVITQEALYALTLGCSMIWRACTNSNHSAVDRQLRSDFSALGVLPRRVAPDRQEVDRITHTPSIIKHDTHIGSPSSALSNSSQVSSHVHETPIRPVPLVRTSSASVKQTSNVADKARAVVSHITHEQVVQAAYAAITQADKAASQELVRHVALDWHKQMEQCCHETMLSAQANAHNQLQMKIQEWSHGWTSELTERGITYRAPNQRLKASFSIVEQRAYGPLAETPEHFERMVINMNPEYCIPVQHVIQVFVTNAQSLVYGSLIERVAALLKINEFSIKRSGSKQTSGRAIQYDTSMYDTLQEAIDAAKEKFKLAQPIDVVPIDKGERGCLPDGRRINWRWGSTEGSPTVEIYNPRNDKKIKIRFVNKESMQ